MKSCFHEREGIEPTGALGVSMEAKDAAAMMPMEVIVLDPLIQDILAMEVMVSDVASKGGRVPMELTVEAMGINDPSFKDQLKGTKNAFLSFSF
jgi:hypothetical protein